MLQKYLPDLDIKSFLLVLVALLAVAVLITFISGVQIIRNSRRLQYYRLRRSRLRTGWRTILAAIILAGITFVVNQFGEPVMYSFYPVTATLAPTPTITLTPTITQTPTITLTSTPTPTLSESYTPTPTATPHIPLAVEVQFSASVTPPAEAVFSPLRFAQGIDLAYNPINPNTSFNNPVGHMYAIFSYDKMADGVQWTALWYRDGLLAYYETKPWEGGTGGFGFSDWEPDPDRWEPGNYQVQVFIGHEIKVVGDFEIIGLPPTETPTRTPTLTPTATLTPTITMTPTITPVPTITVTRWPTWTASPTRTSLPPTATKIPSSTPLPTNTPVPTRTFPPSATP